MGRRRNVKRSLPMIEVVSFESSSTSSANSISKTTKRKCRLTTPDVVEPIHGSDSSSGNEDFMDDTSMQGLARVVDGNDDGNEGDDEEDLEAENANVTSEYRRKQQRSAKGWENIRDAMLRAVIETEMIPDGCLCTECNHSNATFRCLKCGAGVFYCEECVI